MEITIINDDTPINGVKVKRGVTVSLPDWQAKALVGDYLAVPSTQPLLPAAALSPNSAVRVGSIYDWSFIADSRTADLFANPYSTDSRNWFNQANARFKNSLRIIGNYGASGKRTDEYLTNGNFEIALVDGSGWLVFGLPATNDIGSAFGGYVDVFGRKVDLTNVADYAVANLVEKIKLARRAGKRVLCLLEPGSTTWVASQVAAMHEFNRKYLDAIQRIPGVQAWNFNTIIWNKTASATLIGFNAGFTVDGTHAQQMQGRACGIDFATKFLTYTMAPIDSAVASLSNVIANGAGQLFSNPLFITTDQGTAAASITLSSGTVPKDVAVSASAAALLSVAITSAPNDDGFGNDVTFTFTATAAVTGRIDFTLPNANNWEITDVMESGVEYDLAAGSNANIYLQTQLNSNTGTIDAYSLFSGNSGPASGLADKGVVLRTRKNTWRPDSTAKGYFLHRLNLAFPAGGTTAITLRRPLINRYR